MEMQERTVGDVTVLDLKGKLLMGETDEALRQKIKDLSESGKTKILLNLSEVPYMDSAGLGGLVSCYTTVNNKKGKLKLVGLTSRLQDLLSITKLLTVFETFDSEEDALKSY
jgi:anti-sigma B factor antagonist